MIPGLGSSPGEGIDYPCWCSWASLVAQTAKNSPAMQETWVQSLGWEDPLEEGMATHSSITWRVPMDRGAWWATVRGVTKSWTQLSDFPFFLSFLWFCSCELCSGKEPACQTRLGFIPGLGRSPGGRHCNPCQYSCLENPTDREAWWTIVQRVTKN